VHLFPFRLTDERMNRTAGSEWEAFWKNLKEGYDAFEKTRIPPEVCVRGGLYHFDPAGNCEPQ
jgi:murein L,D-transpeptidase YafK